MNFEVNGPLLETKIIPFNFNFRILQAQETFNLFNIQFFKVQKYI